MLIKTQSSFNLRIKSLTTSYLMKNLPKLLVDPLFPKTPYVAPNFQFHCFKYYAKFINYVFCKRLIRSLCFLKNKAYPGFSIFWFLVKRNKDHANENQQKQINKPNGDSKTTNS